MTQAYNIIPDIHANIDRLTNTLACLGYLERDELWAHPEGRIAAFLGDFIDWAMQTAPSSRSSAPCMTEGMPWRSWATTS